MTTQHSDIATLSNALANRLSQWVRQTLDPSPQLAGPPYQVHLITDGNMIMARHDIDDGGRFQFINIDRASENQTPSVIPEPVDIR